MQIIEAYEDIKACHRQARISGMSAFVIGSAATYVMLKWTKTFEKRSKYIPLVCLGVGSCCGYVKSIMVIQKYQSMLQNLEASRNSGMNDSRPETNPGDRSLPLSKYGDEGFHLDEKSSKT
ncbi:uncharacterized protein LOC114533672 isoform X2 [Dendronephthya gigantea]|uniref:uncharacterized protein LOC114533672 isoform X2 n=1 Tax=Dendronephthya gigantea TaxID=151771 RepID=UPI00106A8D82|nr:uncharacterized protein LOC114533672 isoform X2 [Dendronephthya gigantea]